jgi:vesicle-associated membrane protein 7
MAFIYGLVAHGTTPLAEFSLISGPHESTALKILGNLSPKTPRSYVDHQSGIFQMLMEADGMIWLVYTDKSTSQDLRGSFLEDLRARWRQRYGGAGPSLAAHSKTAEFGRTEIAGLLNSFNSSRRQRIRQIEANIEDTAAAMTENLQAALTRGEELAALGAGAREVAEAAGEFRREAAKVRCRAACQRWRWYIVGGTVAAALVFCIVWVACGTAFQHCREKG